MSRNPHTLRIFSGNANPDLAKEIAYYLRRPLGRITSHRLPDSEIHVTIDELVREDDVFIIQPCPEPVNDNLMELLLYIDAFRRASAHAINVVIPYFPYARQERMARGREAISARVVATMLETMGATRVINCLTHGDCAHSDLGKFTDRIRSLFVLCRLHKTIPESLWAAVETHFISFSFGNHFIPSMRFNQIFKGSLLPHFAQIFRCMHSLQVHFPHKAHCL